MVGARGFEPPTSRSRTVRATRLRYAPTRRAHCTESSGLPGVLSHELDELALAAEARLHCAADLLDDGQRLVHGVADRYDHAPALAELLEERRWHRRTAGRHEDPIERRLVGPAQRSPADPHPHLVVAPPPAPCARPLGPARPPPDRAAAPPPLRQH